MESPLSQLRQSLPRVAGVVAFYLVIAVALTWPAAIPGSGVVPGSERSDLYNSLWSIWFFQDGFWRGELPYATTLLDHPDGGRLLVADLPAALWGTILVPLMGLPAAYTTLVLGRLTLGGAAAHGLAWEWTGDGRAAFVAGVALETAPVVLSGVHNGTSEAFSVAPVAFAAWMALRVVRSGTFAGIVATALGLLLSALASWYAAVVAFGFVLVILVFGQGPQGWKGRAMPLVLGLALALPWAALSEAAATGDDNLVRIKHGRELDGVRRTTGPADPRGWLTGGDFRSPDFREMSRYDEQFIHCHYLGWPVFLLGLVGIARRREGRWPLVTVSVGGALLAMGPVVTLGGSAWIFADERAMPLPYLLLEPLPGFSSLSLLWRLGLAPALALGIAASAAVAGRRWAPVVAVAAILLDGVLLSPLGRPGHAPTGIAPAIAALKEAPDGAVLNFPVVGGRGYLYEQTAHAKPLAGTLNFPNNAAGRRVWRALAEADPDEGDAARASVARRARAVGVRYLVVHADALARPDMHDAAVRVARALYAPLPGDRDAPDGTPEAEVYALW